jgi:hypothetical protein
MTVAAPGRMTSERQIWEAALLLVRRHGEEAPDIAGRQSLVYNRQSDVFGSVVWAWIARVSAELVKPAPEASERVH